MERSGPLAFPTPASTSHLPVGRSPGALVSENLLRAPTGSRTQSHDRSEHGISGGTFM